MKCVFSHRVVAAVLSQNVMLWLLVLCSRLLSNIYVYVFLFALNTVDVTYYGLDSV